MKAILASLFAGFALTAGCASVPSDAPDELKTADQAIKHAKDVDADDQMPNTVKEARNKLDHAVSLFKDSQSKDGDRDLVTQSVAEATDAKTMAENAVAVHDDVIAWDQNVSPYLAMKDNKRALTDAQAEIERLRSTRSTASSDTSTGASFDLAQPVAFFETADADLDNAVTPTLDSLVKIMKDNPAMTVHLIGHADKRGDSGFNDTLSQNRADAVAKFLEDQGISQDRIVTEYRGAHDAVAAADDDAKLQIDRRVDATIQAVAH